MELKIPINRSHVMRLLKACWAAVKGQEAALIFKDGEAQVDGKEKPVVLTEREMYKLETMLNKYQALVEYMKDALEDLPEDAPEARELRAALEFIDRPRVLH